ncbi:MAG: outer membrane beta-barrel protein [Xanthobacteraceae bacterium]|nr:outer membrane beta-barrel protein [Xanthobacteraceae bacterium]
MRDRFCVRGCALLAIAATVSFATLNISLSQSALAADMPVKAPVLKASTIIATNWTGFYLTAGGGYGIWAADSNTPLGSVLPSSALPLVQSQGGRGWLGRVGGGFDYQVNPYIVAGVFADYDFSDLKGTIHDARVGLSGDIKQTRAWAAGARAGWLVTPTLLGYANGGYTNARFSDTNMVGFSSGGRTSVGAPSGFVTPAFSTSGWFVGGGMEAALASGWFWRNEYRYARYDNNVIPDVNAFAAGAPSAFSSIHFKPTVQTITTQLVYKFNAGRVAPVARSAATSAGAGWTGGYVNAGFGYGFWAADQTTSLVPGTANIVPVVVEQRSGGQGWLGRFGAGYDHRFGANIVAGVFGDFDVSSLKGSIQDVGAGLDGQTKATWSWAAGGRAGWLIAPDVLSYVNAGYTQTRFSSATMFFVLTAAPFNGLTTSAFTADGWFVGGGVEAAIARGWFWRNEYRYAQYGSEVVTNTSSNPAAGIRNNINFEPTVQTITTQIVYKFNSGS